MVPVTEPEGQSVPEDRAKNCCGQQGPEDQNTARHERAEDKK